jgi:hypothetical protein
VDTDGALTFDPLPADVRAFIDRHRARCLWFMKDDYYPASPTELLRTLGYIERSGDRSAFLHAARIRRWLSHTSNGASAGS